MSRQLLSSLELIDLGSTVTSASFFVSSFNILKMVFPVGYLNEIPHMLVI